MLPIDGIMKLKGLIYHFMFNIALRLITFRISHLLLYFDNNNYC